MSWRNWQHRGFMIGRSGVRILLLERVLMNKEQMCIQISSKEVKHSGITQCIPIVFMTHRSFSVILSSHIGNLSQVRLNLHPSWPTDQCNWHRLITWTERTLVPNSISAEHLNLDSGLLSLSSKNITECDVKPQQMDRSCCYNNCHVLVILIWRLTTLGL